MAEGVLFNVAGEIVKTLQAQLLEEYRLLWGVRDELDKLKDIIATINYILLDAEELQTRSDHVKTWLEKLKEAVYDADDLVDDFAIEAARQQIMRGSRIRKKACNFFSSSNQLVYSLKMGHRIKAITERLEKISADRRFYFVERPFEIPFVSRKGDPTHTPYVGVEEVIGRDGDKRAITGHLLDSDPFLVIFIVGIGGIGKSTLARSVYNDDEIKIKFDLRMWVCVSGMFNLKVIMEKIIESATQKKAKDLELEQLRSVLREEIEAKKYLLVLDDCWEADPRKWFELKDLLSCGERGSRIIVTTRLLPGIDWPAHFLGGLSASESWSLFLQIVFQGQDSGNPYDMDIGKLIVKRCRGVPLAIKTIGGLLHHKNPETEWLSFLDNIIYLGLEEDPILSILRLSYNHLPSQLKHCFAYCALFPKGYEINVQTLVQLWIAQGFIRPSDDPNQCPEDVGFEYVRELLWRCFFQEVIEDELGNVHSCKMHDLMHDLAVSVAGAETQAIVQNPEIINPKTRHLSFHLDWDLLPTSFQLLEH